MPENKMITSVTVIDTIDEIKRSQFLIDSIATIIRESDDDNKLEKVSYLLSIYQEKIAEIFPKLDEITGCKNQMVVL